MCVNFMPNDDDGSPAKKYWYAAHANNAVYKYDDYAAADGIPVPPNETAESNVFIYPNPANDYFTVNYNLDDYKEAFLQITDMTGRTVYQEQLNYEQDELIFLTTDYTVGQYVCTIYADGKVIGSQKFTVTK